MPYYYIRDNNIRIPEGIISLNINILDNNLADDVDISEYWKTISIDTLTVGNDDDEDSILYPANQKLQLYYRDNNIDPLYWLNIFKTNKVNIELKKNNLTYFKGFLNDARLDLNKRLLRLEFTDSIQKLKEIPADNYPPEIGNDLIQYSFLIKKILAQVGIEPSSVYFKHPYILKSGGQNEVTAPAHQCYVYSNYYFGSSRAQFFNNHADVLKGLIDNFACVGTIYYINGQPNFIMLPRKKPVLAQSISLNVIEHIESDIISAYNGIVINMPNNIKHILGDPKSIDYEYFIHAMAGKYGNIHYSNIYIPYQNSTLAAWNAKNPDGQIGWLWELISNEIWHLVSKNRIRIRLKIAHTNISLLDYVSFRDILFRVKQIKYDYINGIAEISLIECL